MAGLPSFSFVAMTMAALIAGFVLQAAQAQAPAPAPTSDGQAKGLNLFIAGTSIDQGVAYMLMLLALVLTYLIHPLDASSSYKLF
ncbi:Arabinogalactan peptide 16 [Platanthera guangdongensis]|uniref:Arabinogalactan peptide 16 n=1 Tax=Platanthera guangdongensis TaxID=2320717 RepID=A0ABR2LEB6_9ASPA